MTTSTASSSIGDDNKNILNSHIFWTSTIFYRGGKFAALYDEGHFEKRALPEDFGGSLGRMNNDDFLKKLDALEDYFASLKKCQMES